MILIDNFVLTKMEKLYDLSEFEALAMGDTGFVRELVAANVESIEEGLKSIVDGFASGDLDAAGQAAHKIKPLLAMLKTGDIHQAIVDIEYFTRKDYDPSRAQQGYDIFASKAPILLQQLKDFMENG